MIKKFDYSKSKEDIFYKIIYPLYPNEFLFGNDYEKFAFIVSANFILNQEQWEYILEHWNEKEKILEDSSKNVCCICNNKYTGYGNNPAPYKNDGECCDDCNLIHVLPLRFNLL